MVNIVGAENNTLNTAPCYLPTIIDDLRLPRDLAPGLYTLGWRWDAEQTAQVWLWASCSDVRIIA